MKETRRILHSAYTAVRSKEACTSLSSLTLDHVLQEQIARRKAKSEVTFHSSSGAVVGKRASELDRLDKLADDIQKVINALRAGEGVGEEYES